MNIRSGHSRKDSTIDKRKKGFAEKQTIAFRALFLVVMANGIVLAFFCADNPSAGTPLFLVLALVLLAVSVTGLLLIKRMSKPLTDLGELVQRANAEVAQRHPFRDSGPESDRPLDAEQSIESISQLFDEYLQIRDSEYSTLLLARQSQFAVLQSQINPHYLYNTLDSIRGDALVAGVPEIADVAEALSNFFRYSISQSEDFVLVSQELENARNYFFIQQYRMGDRLTVEIEADMDELNQYYIPKLIIQPLLENSINYGLAPKIEPGKISIHVGLSQTHLSIVVSDNGIGIDEKTLQSIRERINRKDTLNTIPAQSNSRHKGMALHNINQRIQLLFGYEYGLYITSTPGLGTDVTILVPAITSPPVIKR